MKVSFIGCPFRTTYGQYIAALKEALERKTPATVKWVASNCGCNDPIELARQFQTRDMEYFEMRYFTDFRSSNPLKRALRYTLRNAGYYPRAARYTALSGDAEVIHLQQTLNAYGSDVAFHLLRRKAAAARVVTVHELDPEQLEFPERNKTYNLAGAVIVHDRDLKQKMVALGVRPELIHVVCYGTQIPPSPPTVAREGIVFYGGHRLMRNKGIKNLFDAYALVVGRLGAGAPRLRVHGHYGNVVPPEAIALTQAAGVADRVDWLNQIPTDEIAKLYRSSLLCILPYTGSAAGFACGIAAANELAIVATKNAGIPDHISDLGIWVEPEKPADLADKIVQSLQDEPLRRDLGARLRQHAQQFLAWDVVALATHDVYRSAVARAATPH